MLKMKVATGIQQKMTYRAEVEAILNATNTLFVISSHQANNPAYDAATSYIHEYNVRAAVIHDDDGSTPDNIIFVGAIGDDNTMNIG